MCEEIFEETHFQLAVKSLKALKLEILYGAKEETSLRAATFDGVNHFNL